MGNREPRREPIYRLIRLLMLADLAAGLALAAVGAWLGQGPLLAFGAVLAAIGLGLFLLFGRLAARAAGAPGRPAP